MRAARATFSVLTAILALAQAMAQTPYPDLTIQNVAWEAGTHHYAVTQRILSPSNEWNPVSISGTADAEFVSGTQVRLTPGFHAGGFAGSGRFRARIDDALGPPGDVVVIAQEPYSYIADNVVHVNKWEKVEVGVRLPQAYMDAIDRFFEHYYPYPDDASDPDDEDDPYISAPSNTDPVHDLNPYADDSLQLVMTLTDPSGDLRMKWGFYMREARWEPNPPELYMARTTHNEADPLDEYRARFRFAPDEEGAWQFTIGMDAPHTSTMADEQLAAIQCTGYSFVCEPPLPDNKGPLNVNDANRRNLEFAESNEPFFALGVNMAGGSHGDFGRNTVPHTGSWWYTHFERDQRDMQNSMTLLHEAGGNFMRVFMMPYSFAPEWVNLGVYDAYRAPVVCDLSESSAPNEPDCDRGWSNGFTGNCQYQCWAYDQLVDHARTNNIYIQLCVDPYPPVVAYEKLIWGGHPYVVNYLDRNRPASGNPYDVKQFFYQDGNTAITDEGVLYYWKRKYKYIMSRWGYSVNIPIIEPFNEIDQMLSYGPLQNGTLGSNEPVYACAQATDVNVAHRDICRENRGAWAVDTGLPGVVSSWVSDISDFVRGDIDPDYPVYSPLGEDRKLFLASYASGDPNDPNADTYYAPFLNPDVDIIDAHRGLHNPWDLQAYSSVVEDYRDAFTTNGVKKPFNHGEFSHFLELEYNDENFEISPYFHNYDIAFHNELWASAFSGKFAAGTTWHWPRVFWWEGSQKAPPPDGDNLFQSGGPYQFNNGPEEWNQIKVNDVYYDVQNRSAYHNFKPLADLLNHPSWLAYDFFSNDYKVRQNADFTGLEAYYLQNSVPPFGLSTVAIGWVRNRNSSVFNSYYLASSEQQFFSCEPPDPSTDDELLLPMFEPGSYYVSWFPTRMNSTVHPPDGQVSTSFSGTIYLDLADQFGGIANDYLDTLRGDYAFIITPEFFEKSMPYEPVANDGDWDFTVYPNPSREAVTLRFQDDAPKEVMILDLAGRLIVRKAGVAATSFQFPELRLAQGAYWVRVSDGVHSRTKKLILQ